MTRVFLARSPFFYQMNNLPRIDENFSFEFSKEHHGRTDDDDASLLSIDNLHLESLSFMEESKDSQKIREMENENEQLAKECQELEDLLASMEHDENEYRTKTLESMRQMKMTTESLQKGNKGLTNKSNALEQKMEHLRKQNTAMQI